MPLRHGLIAVILLLVMLPGCASLVEAPRVALKDTRLVGLDRSGLDLEFQLGITNPNPFDLSLQGYTYDLLVLDLPLSSGGMQATALFPAGMETGVRLPVRLKYSDLMEIINRSPDLDDIPYQLKGMLHLKTPLGEMALPVEKRAVLTIPEQYRPAAYINWLRDALRGTR